MSLVAVCDTVVASSWLPACSSVHLLFHLSYYDALRASWTALGRDMNLWWPWVVRDKEFTQRLTENKIGSLLADPVLEPAMPDGILYAHPPERV